MGEAFKEIKLAAEMAAPPAMTGQSVIKKISYTHDAMIDLILAEPSISQRVLAAKFGYTEGWISQVFSSDGFKARLAERKAELIDPTIAASLEQRFEGVARLSLQIIQERLELNRSGDLAVKALDLSAKALGFGARDKGPVVNNQFVVHLPAKSATTAEWVEQYAPKGQPGPVIDVTPQESAA